MRVLRHSTFLLLAATIPAATAVAQPAPEPGDATFVVFVRGTQIGLERIALARTASGWILKGSGRLAAPFDLTTRNYELRCAADWQPINLVIAATIKGQPASITSSFGLTTVVSEIHQGGQTSAKTDEISPRTIVLPGNFFAAYEALAVRLAGAGPDAPLRAYLAPQGEVAVQIRRVTDQPVQTPSGPVAVKRYAITLHRPDAPLEVDLWVDSRQRLARVDIPSASLVVSRQDIVSVMARTETIRNPGDRDVTIPASGFTLAATLTQPSSGRVPLPAVVLVGASGPQDREEATGRVPVFGQLAGALAAAGFLVVRYDKRGVGQSGGRGESATLADYAEDVRAVGRFLRSRKDVDRNRIAAVGYGDGGWVAMLAASKDDTIRGLALIAAMSGTGAAFTLERQQQELDHLGLPPEERAARVDLQKRIIAAVMTGKGWETVPPEVRAQADTAWFHSFLAFDAARVLARVDRPILILHGELDAEVSPSHADRLAEQARARKKGPPVEVGRIPGVNHLLVPARTGRPDEYAVLADATVSPEVAGTLAAWMAKLPAK